MFTYLGQILLYASEVLVSTASLLVVKEATCVCVCMCMCEAFIRQGLSAN